MRLEAITMGAETQLAIKKKIVLTDDLLLIACSPPCSAHFAILWYKNSLISLQMKQLEAFNRRETHSLQYLQTYKWLSLHDPGSLPVKRDLK